MTKEPYQWFLLHNRVVELIARSQKRGELTKSKRKIEQEKNPKATDAVVLYFDITSEVWSLKTEIWNTYSHLSNVRGGWNRCGGGTKNAKSLNVEGVINVNFWARGKFYSSKWPWGKSSLGSAIISDTLVMKSINVVGGFLLWMLEFFKIGNHDFTFIREMRVL